MSMFKTMRLPAERDEVAPDGSNVRVLLGVTHGGMAHFELPPSETSTGEIHPGFDEIWYILSGHGEMWRKKEDQEMVVGLEAGVCITIPAKTIFQFRANNKEPLKMIGATMPPWTGPESVESVEGIWKPTVGKKS
jgi:mannose-6-phosphate isomerase-like protein (cupin superfamily)